MIPPARGRRQRSGSGAARQDDRGAVSCSCPSDPGTTIAPITLALPALFVQDGERAGSAVALGMPRGYLEGWPRGDFFAPRWAGILSQDTADEWGKSHAEAMQRAKDAIARAEDTTAYADDVLTHLYLIRDRLATMERQAAVLAASFRTN